MPNNSALIAQFRKAKTMTAFTQGQLFQFKLDQTAQLLPALANCVATVKQDRGRRRRRVRGALAEASRRRQGRRNRIPRRPRPNRSVNQTGTGFVVSTSGHVVTNQHVVDGCVGDILGNLTGEAPVKLRLVSSDETNDLALLQAPSAFKEMAVIQGQGDPVRARAS